MRALPSRQHVYVIRTVVAVENSPRVKSIITNTVIAQPGIKKGLYEGGVINIWYAASLTHRPSSCHVLGTYYCIVPMG